MGIAISYSTYSVTFDKFLDENVPRTYLEEGTLDYSLSGTTILGGPSRVSKRIWAISGILSTEDAQALDAMYLAWLTAKSTGAAALVSLTDDIFTPTSISANALFSTAPTYTSFAPTLWIASLGLTEA